MQLITAIEKEEIEIGYFRFFTKYFKWEEVSLIGTQKLKVAEELLENIGDQSVTN